MKTLPIVIVGAGGHAQACIDVVEQEGRFHVVAIIGLAHEVGRDVLGHRVFGTDEALPALVGKTRHALIGVGQIATPEPRVRLYQVLQSLGYVPQSIISPHAYVSPHSSVGPGSIVMHGAIVNAGAIIGCNCILNSHSLIEHGASIADHCHVSTRAVVNGNAKIGRGTFVGSGAIIRQSVNIGRDCFIGMGQAVTADCPDATRIKGSESIN